MEHHAPPMPLKHFTETFLIAVLAVVIAVTGVLMATLPDLPEGALPWTIVFAFSIVYPLSLYSLFQRRRADNFFRNLHWFPAGMLLFWLALQGIALGTSLEFQHIDFYTWGWSFIAVLLGFVSIVYFVLKVIRRRVPRLGILAAILVPFFTLAFVSEMGPSWEEDMTAFLWEGGIWSVDHTFIADIISGDSGTGKNLEPSEDQDEEKWRERLRMLARREERLSSRMNAHSQSTSSRSSDGEMSISSSIMVIGDLSSLSSSSSASEMLLSGTGDEIRNAGSMPNQLPHSGFGWTMIISLLGVGYVATLHRRAVARV